MTALPWVWDDGGRRAAGFKGDAGDCVVRAVSIVDPGADYLTVYNQLAEYQHRLVKGAPRSARNGVDRKVLRRYLDEGPLYSWTPTMGIGTGCKVHLAEGELPSKGRLLVSVSKHMVAVIDGVVHDTYDPTRDGTRCVYGYWKYEET